MTKEFRAKIVFTSTEALREFLLVILCNENHVKTLEVQCDEKSTMTVAEFVASLEVADVIIPTITKDGTRIENLYYKRGEETTTDEMEVVDVNLNETQQEEKNASNSANNSTELPTENEVQQEQAKDEVNIQDFQENLKEIEKNATSFDDMVIKIADLLDLGSRKKYFVGVVKASIEVDKIKWKNIEAKLQENGVGYTQFDRTRTSKQVSAITGTSILAFVKSLVEKKCNFDQAENEVALTEEFPKEEEKILKSPSTENATLSEPTSWIKERLSPFGFETLEPKVQEEILKIARVAVSIQLVSGQEWPSFSELFALTDISEDEILNVQMEFSTLLNSDCPGEVDIRVIDFLKQINEEAQEELLPW